MTASLYLYDCISDAAGERWPVSLGDAVEIGCGTGGFTMAMLSKLPASRVVLTDISLKMLDICRRRLGGMSDLRAEALTFATFAGTETCFRTDAFDTCFGTSVLHHILDVPRLLAQIHGFLKPGGRAFFLEPNLSFHRALTATLAQILDEWARDGSLPDADTAQMLNWMAEVHCNVVNSGELDVLADREDKHMFVAETFETMAKAAGFGTAAALVCGLDPAGESTIKVYLTQCGVSAGTLDRLMEAWAATQNDHFGALKSRDLSPSYLLWLEKSAVVPGPAPTRLWMTLVLRRSTDGLEIDTSGWCLGAEPVKSVQIGVGDRVGRLPIWRPRLDLLPLTTPGDYPPLQEFCAGIEGTVHLPGVRADGPTAEAIVSVVTLDGRLLSTHSIMLVPDGDAGLLQF